MEKFYKSLENKARTTEIPTTDKIRYAGLNIRLIANMIDMLLLFLLTLPLLFFVHVPAFGQIPADAPDEFKQAYAMHSSGEISDTEFKQMVVESGYLQQKVLPKMLAYSLINLAVVAIIYILFWKRYNSTPGKMLFKISIVDAKSMGKPTTGQYIVRFIGYIVSAVPLLIGYMMIGMNKRKRGLHDMMAGTLVIYTDELNPEWEKKKIKYKLIFMLLMLTGGAIYLSSRM